MPQPRDRKGRYGSEPIEARISRSFTDTVNEAMRYGHSPESAISMGATVVDGMIGDERSRRAQAKAEQ